MKNILLYKINDGTTSNFSVQHIDNSGIKPIAENIQCIESFMLNNITYIIAFDKNNSYYIYQALSSGLFMVQLSTGIISSTANLISILDISGTFFCLVYDSIQNMLIFFKITSDLKLEQVYQLNAPGTFTTLKTFSYREKTFFIMYDIITGSVYKYQVAINTSPETFSVENVWSDTWAKGWTRFSFFQLGTENFFIKTNISYKKVNIDHFMDDPNEGSHPVLNIDAPEQMIDANNVVVFLNTKGFPFFATYNSTNGMLTFNSIYANCQGWDSECELTTDSEQELMLTFCINSENYILLY